MMRAVALLLVLAGPVVTDFNGCVNKEKTCHAICKSKLGKPIYLARQIGVTDGDGWRVCECYPARIVVVDDLPEHTAEAPEQKP